MNYSFFVLVLGFLFFFSHFPLCRCLRFSFSSRKKKKHFPSNFIRSRYFRRLIKCEIHNTFSKEKSLCIYTSLKVAFRKCFARLVGNVKVEEMVAEVVELKKQCCHRVGCSLLLYLPVYSFSRKAYIYSVPSAYAKRNTHIQ